MKRRVYLSILLLLSSTVGNLFAAQVKNHAHSHNGAAVKNEKECAIWPQKNFKTLETALGKKAELYPDEGVIKFSFERPDIKVLLNKQELDPFLSSNTWVAFQKGIKPGVETMMMGHIALHDYEVNDAIDMALKYDLDVTSVHSHIFSDKPVYFIHINEEGDLKKIAKGISEVLKTTGKKKAATKKVTVPQQHAITADPLEKILQVKGEASEGKFKAEFGRLIQASCGCPIGKSMGVHSWAAFGGTDAQAIVNGDIVATEQELQDVLKELRKGNATITAVHNHMIGESPRLIFVHYYAQGKASDLAQLIRNTLNKTSDARSEKDQECKTCPKK